MDTRDTFLDLSVGPYSLALAAQAVLTVAHEVTREDGLSLHEQQLSLVDLAPVFGGPRRPIVPFVVAFEHAGHVAAVGVDLVHHVGHLDSSPHLAVPPFGLTRPELIDCALRDGDRLLLVLSPAGLVRLTKEENPLI